MSPPPANATVAARNTAPPEAPSRPERQPETELTASTMVNASTHSTSGAENAAPTAAAFCINPGTNMITLSFRFACPSVSCFVVLLDRLHSVTFAPRLTKIDRDQIIH